MNWVLIGKLSIIPLLFLVSFIVYMKWPALKQDNAVEEFVEAMVEKKLYIDIDLSPNSPEE